MFLSLFSLLPGRSAAVASNCLLWDRSAGRGSRDKSCQKSSPLKCSEQRYPKDLLMALA